MPRFLQRLRGGRLLRPLRTALPAWVRPVLTGVARTVLTAAVGLLVWTQIPMLLGWSPTLVSTGSMAPHLMPGDVVVYEHGGHPRKNQVVLFRDPNNPSRLISHRIRTVKSDGTLITQGDANPTADSAAVRPPFYVGYARLRVPWIGLPALWRRQHDYAALAVTLCAVLCIADQARPRLRAPLPPR